LNISPSELKIKLLNAVKKYKILNILKEFNIVQLLKWLNIPIFIPFISVMFTQREIFKYIVLELGTFVLKNRVNTFWYQCSQY